MGLSGLLVFTFGVLLAPLAHNIGHRPDHVHGDGHFALALSALRGQLDAAHAHAHPHAHPHPGGHAHGGADPFAPLHEHAHEGGALELPPAGESERDAGRGSDPHHGEGSLAHFAAAVLAPALFVVPPACVAAERLVPLPLASVCHGRRALGPIQPRAPPA